MKLPQQSESMENTTPSKAKRRALLGAISTAGVVGAAKLPGQWTRPVVDHVLLPAHAATTDDTGAAGSGVSTFITTVTSNCVVTCTSAYALISNQSATMSNSSIYVSSYTYFWDYVQCSNSLGGVTTSAGSMSSGNHTGTYTSGLSSTFYCGSVTSYTTNAVCNVTVTSS